MKRTLSLLAAAIFAVGAAFASGRIDLKEEYVQAHLTANGELYVTYKLGYDTSSSATTVDSRDFDFNISYGIVGGNDTYTATMSSSGTMLPAGAGSKYKIWYIAGEGGTAPAYTSPAIPGLQGDNDVWYRVCVSNTLHNGAAPTGSDDLTTTMATHYAYAAYRDVGCAFSQTPWQYNISGVATPGLGYVTARLTYAHNKSTLGSGASTLTAAIGADGAFSFGVPAVGNGANVMTMTWKVELLDGNGDVLVCKDYLGDSVHTETIADVSRVTYTWTGNGDGRSWADGNNWSQDVESCLGYPGVKNSYYWDTIIFNTDADVDLGGKKYGIRDGGGTFITSAGIHVTLRNGTIDVNDAAFTFGANGTTVTFDSVVLNSGGGTFTLGIASGATLCFSGTSTGVWKWKPTKENVNFIVRDGTTTTRYDSPTIKTTTFTTISNAVWSISNSSVGNGTGYVTYFRDGPNRQAQLKIASSYWIDLRYTYDIIIPKGGHATHCIEAGYLNSDSNAGTFRVDVTDYESDARVPLVKFTNTNSTYKNYNNTRAPSQISGGTLLVKAMANGRDVTSRRHAKLVWDTATQTIYYQQDKVQRQTFFIVQ